MIKKIIDKEFFDELSAQARASKRLRSHYCLHESHQDKVQRMYIAAEPGTYLRPHAHLQEDKWEYISLVRGRADYLLFSPEGELLQRIMLEGAAGVSAIEIGPASWHSLVVYEPGTVLFEVKAGPFDAAAISRFAEWSPEENTPAVNQYIQMLMDLKAGAMAVMP